MTTHTTFPETDGRDKGYEQRAVDAFLTHARSAFDEGDENPAMTADDVRQTAFPLVRGGYQISAVDQALSRLEDAFAARERGALIASMGADAWIDHARTRAQEILNRLTRPAGHRFRRAGVLHYGYRIDEVDLVSDKLAAYFADGAPVTAEQVRAAAFRMQRNGYAEEQVDAVLDAVVEVMLAITPGRG